MSWFLQFLDSFIKVRRTAESNSFADKTAADTAVGQDVTLYDINLLPYQFPDYIEKKEEFAKLVMKRFPEFKFSTFDLGTATRTKYNGNYNYCCATNKSFYYTDYNGNILKDDIKDDTVRVIFYTCHPLSNKIRTSDYCNATFLETCVYRIRRIISNNNINDLTKPFCPVWFDGFLERSKLYPHFKSVIHHIIQFVCTGNGAYMGDCITYLKVFSKVKIQEYTKIKDRIIDGFNDDIKRRYFPCSFPLPEVKAKSKYIVEPRQCWDPNCTFSEDWQLRTEDLIIRTTECTNVLCDVNFSHINIKEGDILISCKTNNNTLDNPIISYKNTLNYFISNFQIISFNYIIILIFTLLFLYTLFYNVNRIITNGRLPMKVP